MFNLQVRLRLDHQLITQALAEGAPLATALHQYRHLYLHLLQKQRALLYNLNQRFNLNEELTRKGLSLLDLEEYKLRAMAPETAAE